MHCKLSRIIIEAAEAFQHVQDTLFMLQLQLKKREALNADKILSS